MQSCAVTLSLLSFWGCVLSHVMRVVSTVINDCSDQQYKRL